jgi:hypothetical protein
MDSVKHSNPYVFTATLLGKEDLFFELREAIAQETWSSVQTLVRLGRLWANRGNWNNPPDPAARIRRPTLKSAQPFTPLLIVCAGDRT